MDNIDFIVSKTTLTKNRARRARTNFDSNAIKFLEDVFVKNPYPDINEREKLAERIDTTEARIQVWFQNKRSRHRKCLTKTSKPKTESFDDSYASVDSTTDRLSLKTSSPILNDITMPRLNSTGNSLSSSPETQRSHQELQYYSYYQQSNSYAMFN
jgi:hypothetical protein